jgi:hypothetical protein
MSGEDVYGAAGGVYRAAKEKECEASATLGGTVDPQLRDRLNTSLVLMLRERVDALKKIRDADFKELTVGMMSLREELERYGKEIARHATKILAIEAESEKCALFLYKVKLVGGGLVAGLILAGLLATLFRISLGVNLWQV